MRKTIRRLLLILVPLCFLLTACGGKEETAATAASPTPTKAVVSYGTDAKEIQAIREKYQGGWYGWLELYDCVGYDFSDGFAYDVCADFDFDAGPEGSPVALATVWSCGDGKAKPLSTFTVQFGTDDSWSIGGAELMGLALSTMRHSYHEAYPDMLSLSGSVQNETGSFSFVAYLRPWATRWEDVKADSPEALPYNYDDWYLPLVEAGKDMPT